MLNWWRDQTGLLGRPHWIGGQTTLDQRSDHTGIVDTANIPHQICGQPILDPLGVHNVRVEKPHWNGEYRHQWHKCRELNQAGLKNKTKHTDMEEEGYAVERRRNDEKKNPARYNYLRNFRLCFARTVCLFDIFLCWHHLPLPCCYPRCVLACAQISFMVSDMRP